jgi:hypothetical protein
MAKKTQHQKLQSIVSKLARKFRPDEILHEFSVLYEEYSASSDTEAEVEFWLKLSRAHGNLSSGANKWIYEMVEDREEELRGEEEEEG